MCTYRSYIYLYTCRAESGFTHVEAEKYEPRLLHVKGKKVYIIMHIFLAWFCIFYNNISVTVCMNVFIHLIMLWVLQDNVRIDEVKLRRKYINSGDVFILDLGLKIFQVF